MAGGPAWYAAVGVRPAPIVQTVPVVQPAQVIVTQPAYVTRQVIVQRVGTEGVVVRAFSIARQRERAHGRIIGAVVVIEPWRLFQGRCSLCPRC